MENLLIIEVHPSDHLESLLFVAIHREIGVVFTPRSVEFWKCMFGGASFSLKNIRAVSCMSGRSALSARHDVTALVSELLCYVLVFRIQNHRVFCTIHTSIEQYRNSYCPRILPGPGTPTAHPDIPSILTDSDHPGTGKAGKEIDRLHTNLPICNHSAFAQPQSHSDTRALT